MVRLIDADELIRELKSRMRYWSAVVDTIDAQPHIIIDKVNTLDEIKKRGVFVARKEK